MIDRLHALASKLGISPKVADPFIAAVGLALANLIVTGSLDIDGLRLAVAALILGALGIAAPPAYGLTQNQVERLARRRE